MDVPLLSASPTEHAIKIWGLGGGGVGGQRIFENLPIFTVYGVPDPKLPRQRESLLEVLATAVLPLARPERSQETLQAPVCPPAPI